MLSTYQVGWGLGFAKLNVRIQTSCQSLAPLGATKMKTSFMTDLYALGKMKWFICTTAS